MFINKNNICLPQNNTNQVCTNMQRCIVCTNIYLYVKKIFFISFKIILNKYIFVENNTIEILFSNYIFGLTF